MKSIHLFYHLFSQGQRGHGVLAPPPLPPPDQLLVSAMQEQARLGEFLVQNSSSAPTQVSEKCGAQSIPPPPEMNTWPD